MRSVIRLAVCLAMGWAAGTVLADSDGAAFYGQGDEQITQVTMALHCYYEPEALCSGEEVGGGRGELRPDGNSDDTTIKQVTKALHCFYEPGALCSGE
jgi:hypothetical protein